MSVSSDPTGSLKSEKAGAAGPRAPAPSQADDEKKNKRQLIDELTALRQRVRALEAEASGHARSGSTRQDLLSASPAIIYTTKASDDFGCTFISENLRAIMGYSPEEMTTDPKTWPEHLHPEDAPRVFDEMAPLMQRGGGTLEYRFQHRDGHYIWIQDTFRVVKDDTGQPIELVGAWADITERKRIETELQGMRQRLQYLLAVSPAIIYTNKAFGDYACTYVSENLRDIMGYTPEEMTTDARCWADHLHPEDAPKVFEELPPLIQRGGGNLEYRFRRRDGQYIWIQDTFKVVSDSDGRAAELVGAWADITEGKRAEQNALRANVELQDTKRYLTCLIEGSTDAIIATDRKGSVVLFNEGAEILLGYRAEEVIGRQESDFRSAMQPQAFYDDLYAEVLRTRRH